MDRNKKIIKTSILGILTNILLVAFKATIGLLVNSIAITLDALNNLTDVISSVVTIVGTKLANKAPDKEHPYGHGRIEYFTSVIIAAIILFAGIMAIKESVEKIINPADTKYSIVALVIIGVTVFVKIFLGTYVKKTGKSVNSQSLVASGIDALWDAVVSFSTLIAGIINYIWNFNLEGYVGVIISLLIIKSAIGMLKQSANSMLGERADRELSVKLRKRVLKFDEVQGVYDLNLHNYGPSRTVASLHIQVRSDMNAGEIHILTRDIAYQIYNELGIMLTIGIYAANDEGEFAPIKAEIDKIVDEYKEVLQIHGFYVDKEKSNVFFDLIIDFDAKDKEKIRQEIIEKMKEKFPEYSYNIIIDPDITDLS